MVEIKTVEAQEGYQLKFLSSSADIVIGGAAAGVGKTYSLLLEPLRHIENPQFGGVIFRRTSPQVRNEGGLWDTSMSIYPHVGGQPRESFLEWRFPAGGKLKFSHLQYDKDTLEWQGSQIAFIGFDELTHFSESQWWYLFSRNRSTSGVSPYIRATCNPDPDSFLVTGNGGWGTGLISWWIGEDGFPIPERNGIIRYFMRDKGEYIWGNTKQEVISQCEYLFTMVETENKEDLVKSITFISGSIYDNKHLLNADPSYLANLMAQDDEARLQLLEGNWKVRRGNSGLYGNDAIDGMFTNYVNKEPRKYITCDAARLGRDLCVIMVWQGWEVLHTTIWKQSDVHDIIESIESLRRKFLIPKTNVLIDQDGVGAGTVRQGGYRGFSGGEQPKMVKGLKENYKNLKTQCAYYLAHEKVNIGAIRINMNNECCIIDGVFGTKMKLGQRVVDVSVLIKEDFRAIERDKIDAEGKLQMNTKEAQKIKLKRSPDFFDTIMMRVWFDLMPKNLYL